MKTTLRLMPILCISMMTACSLLKSEDDDDDDWTNEDFDGGADNGSADGIDADGSGSGSGGSGSGGSGSGGSASGGSESGGSESGGSESGGAPAESCPHPYNPVDKSGWTKTYGATFIDDLHGSGSAVATEQGMESGYTSTGEEAFKTWESMTVSGSPAWEGTVYHFCDHESLRGLSVPEWNMVVTYTADVEGTPLSPGSVLMTLSSPRQYLPGTEMIGTGETWNFDYTLTHTDTGATTAPVFIITIPVSGTYTDQGLKEITVMGETQTAWHIRSTYGMTLESPPPDTGDTDAAPLDTGTPTTITGVPGFTRDFPGQADYYWVEGVGLVYEKHVDTETGAIILEKTLNDVTGL